MKTLHIRLCAASGCKLGAGATALCPKHEEMRRVDNRNRYRRRHGIPLDAPDQRGGARQRKAVAQ